jgi:opacity protein-like surface antigen
MRKILYAALVAALMPAAANAATWIAACTDGKNVQYNQTIGGKGVLYLQTTNGDYQGITLAQSSYDGNVVCGTADVELPSGAAPFIKACADKAHNIVTLKYKDPTGKGQSIDDRAPYCQAAVTVH